MPINQPQPVTNNSRIAKNAVMLYIRMFITLVIGLYTSRVVLNTLGVEDFGIYGVVGGIVAMMGFLNASMSGATSRFLTFELGRGDQERLAKTFSSAMIVHIGIAIVVFILAETVGLWFLCNKLVIPPDRMSAAHWVYQCSIISAMLGITQVPYNSTIIAHEKMDIYAFVEIFHTLLKLAIVFILGIGAFDRLKLYAVLFLSVTVLILCIYRVYCVKHFKESHFRLEFDGLTLKPLLSFSVWNLFSEMAFSVRQQGVGFLLNIFFGLIYNAAHGIANVVQGTILAFSSNIVMAFRPQIIKSYAVAEFGQMNNLMGMAVKITMFMLSLATVPLYVNAEYILCLWLKEVPSGAVLMTRMSLIINLVNTLSSVLMCGIQASGRIRLYSILTGSLYFMSLLVMYLFLKLSYGYEVIYYILVAVSFTVLTIYLTILKLNVPQFELGSMLLKRIVPIFVVVLVAYLSTGFFFQETKSGFEMFIVSSIISSIVLLVLFMALIFGAGERAYLLQIIRTKFLFNRSVKQ